MAKDPIADAVRQFWTSRADQTQKQRDGGRSDQGSRGAVTGGKQMDGFTQWVRAAVIAAGIPDGSIFIDEKLELPGYFRATKKWDLLVVHKGRLAVGLETKSQVGPSFGNNFNNRTEEAIGSAADIWTAYREGAFGKAPRPWLGYVFHLEDCASSCKSVRTDEPHFAVFKEFRNASYQRRYELLCRRLVRERLYDSAVFLVSTPEGGTRGKYGVPAEDLSVEGFIKSLQGHLTQFV